MRRAFARLSSILPAYLAESPAKPAATSSPSTNSPHSRSTMASWAATSSADGATVNDSPEEWTAQLEALPSLEELGGSIPAVFLAHGRASNSLSLFRGLAHSCAVADSLIRRRTDAHHAAAPGRAARRPARDRPGSRRPARPVPARPRASSPRQVSPQGRRHPLGALGDARRRRHDRLRRREPAPLRLFRLRPSVRPLPRPRLPSTLDSTHSRLDAGCTRSSSSREETVKSPSASSSSFRPPGSSRRGSRTSSRRVARTAEASQDQDSVRPAPLLLAAGSLG